MKQLIAILALLAIGITSNGQVFTTKATPVNAVQPTSYYGNQSTNYYTGTICAVVANTVTPVSSGKKDTLTNVDTGFVQFVVNPSYNLLFDYTVTKISGTVAGTALLQGSLDNATWFTITGNTTYCAGCQGASATVTNTAGTKHYQWFIPNTATNYPYYQIQVITSGTMTATYAATAVYKR